MANTPITPTAVIPPGAPLPPQVPPPPPANWWPTPPPTPGPIQVHVTLHPAPLPPPPTRWQRLAAWLRQFGQPWQAAAALALAVTPIPWTGYSVATTWAYTVDLGRDLGPWQPYALGCIPFALVVARILRRGGSVRSLFLLVVTGFGVYGACDWFDLVTIITGVTR